MSWVLVIAAAWVLLAVVTAVLIGRSVRLADQRAEAAEQARVDESNFVVDPSADRQGTVVPFPTADEGRASRPAHDTPTIPGIPVARPRAPGADRADGRQDPIRRTGLA